ncbi:MAG TPA: four helix bundle protein [Longimicrobiaceae bacterium]|nr:four helix bundle protein [Longimicrobiaceae bacterium]
MKENVVREKSYAFALRVVDLYRGLVAEREYVLSKQMLRAGTSIGANVEEALAAQSRRDFIAKMSIASKEARECCYWLRLLRDSGTVPKEVIDPFIADSHELVLILTSIVKSASESRS